MKSQQRCGGSYIQVLHSRGSAAPNVFDSSCSWPFRPLPYGLVAGECKMDQADWKLRDFYQYQIAKIAKLAREQTHSASRKRLDFIVNQYIDMLLVMPRPSERMKDIETKTAPTSVTRQRRRLGGLSAAGRRKSSRRISRTGRAVADRQIGQLQ